MGNLIVGIFLVLLIPILGMIAFLVFAWLFALPLKYYRNKNPNKKMPSKCPACHESKLVATTIGFVWKFYGFYPILFLPIFIIIYLVIKGTEDIALVSMFYVLIFYLFLSVIKGLALSIIGNADYKCVNCGKTFFSYSDFKNSFDKKPKLSEDPILRKDCPHGHGELKMWDGKLRCWTCGWPEK